MSEQQGPVYGDVPRYGYQHLGPPAPPPPPSMAPGPPFGQNPFPQSYPQPFPPPVPPYQGGYPPYQPLPAFVPVYPYAHWGRRVGAYLLDFWPTYVALVPFYVGYFLYLAQVIQLTTDPSGPLPELTSGLIWMGIGLVLLLGALGWQIYNRWLTGGRTGQSLGKRVMKLRLLAESTGQPIGPLNAFARDMLHIVDGLAYVGYLWPLWDEKRQTFADKLMRTVVTDDRMLADPHGVTGSRS